MKPSKAPKGQTTPPQDQVQSAPKPLACTRGQRGHLLPDTSDQGSPRLTHRDASISQWQVCMDRTPVVAQSSDCAVQPSNTWLCTYSGELLLVVGKAMVEVHYDKQQVCAPMHICS